MPPTVKTLTSGPSSQAAQAVNQFAYDLYQYYQQQTGNLFLSPLSIATALAMTYEGARGATATQMADVLHLGNPSTIAQSFQSLLGTLNSENSQSVQMSVANALWPQEGYPFLNSFLQLIQADYGGTAQNVDYISNAEGARETINAWVSQKTDGKIPELLAPGIVSSYTRLVLTNAVYFDDQWATPFDPKETSNEPFYLLSSQTVQTPLMYSESEYAYEVQDGYQVLDLPYQGGTMSMVVLLPQNTDAVTNVSGGTLEAVNDWLNTDPGTRDVIVQLPKFQMAVSSELNQVLAGMGMPLAFGNADFSGMASPSAGPLSISDVVHKVRARARFRRGTRRCPPRARALSRSPSWRRRRRRSSSRSRPPKSPGASPRRWRSQTRSPGSPSASARPGCRWP